MSSDELAEPVETIREYAIRWLDGKQPPESRRWTYESYRKHLHGHVLPAPGDLTFDELTTRVLLDFCTALRRKLAPKTCRDIVDGSFRAMVRDARTIDSKLAHDPFDGIEWRKFMATQPRSEPDPYTAEERDIIVDWFRTSCGWYYSIVYTAFGTGMRTGELLGLRHEHVDLRKGELRVRVSRSWNEDNAPKTDASRRTVALTTDVVQVLRAMPTRLDATPRSFYFTNQHGQPIKQEDFTREQWRRAHVATGVRQRGGFYQTRHTFIALALTAGVNLKFLAKHCGTSIEMIERSYGAFLGSQTDELAKLAAPRLAVARRSA